MLIIVFFFPLSFLDKLPKKLLLAQFSKELNLMAKKSVKHAQDSRQKETNKPTICSWWATKGMEREKFKLQWFFFHNACMEFNIPPIQQSRIKQPRPTKVAGQKIKYKKLIWHIFFPFLFCVHFTHLHITNIFNLFHCCCWIRFHFPLQGIINAHHLL